MRYILVLLTTRGFLPSGFLLEIPSVTAGAVSGACSQVGGNMAAGQWLCTGQASSPRPKAPVADLTDDLII